MHQHSCTLEKGELNNPSERIYILVMNVRRCFGKLRITAVCLCKVGCNAREGGARASDRRSYTALSLKMSADSSKCLQITTIVLSLNQGRSHITVGSTGHVWSAIFESRFGIALCTIQHCRYHNIMVV